MKKGKILAAAVLSAVLGTQALLMTGCGSEDNNPINGEKFEMAKITDYTTYDNGDFSEYDNGNTEKRAFARSMGRIRRRRPVCFPL